MVSDGEMAGSSATGSVNAIWRRTGVTGMVTPTMSPIWRDHAPAAQTTVLVLMRPCAVRTSVMVPALTGDVEYFAVPDDPRAVAAGRGGVAHHHRVRGGLAVHG